MHFRSVSFHDEGGIADHRAPCRHVFAHHGTGTYHGIVAYRDATIHDGTGIDAYAVAYRRPAATAIAQSHVL